MSDAIGVYCVKTVKFLTFVALHLLLLATILLFDRTFVIGRRGWYSHWCGIISKQDVLVRLSLPWPLVRPVQD